MSGAIDETRRSVVIAGAACLGALPTTASANIDPMQAVEARASDLLAALNQLDGRKWVLKVGTDGDVVLFHRLADT